MLRGQNAFSAAAPLRTPIHSEVFPWNLNA